MGKFTKGQSGNPTGRKPGASNKITKELRARIQDFLESKWSQIEEDIDNMEPEKRVALFERLLQYVLPKMQAMAMSGEIDFKTMSEEAIDRIAEKLINRQR